MAKIVSLVLDFAADTGEQPCGAMLLQVPTAEVEVGDALEFRLWADISALDGWRLLCGTESLGPGEIKEIFVYMGDLGSTIEQIAIAKEFSFEATFEGQFDWPITALVRVEALTELLKLDALGNPIQVAARGAVCTELFARKGGSCLKVADETPLYGTIQAVAERVRWYRSWSWTVPARTAGGVWFFLYDSYSGAPYKRFALELPGLEENTGAIKNVTIEAVDHSTEAPIANTEIYLDGAYRGKTNAEGKLKVDGIVSGKHLFRAVAPGYLTTDADELSNEEIVVS